MKRAPQAKYFLFGLSPEQVADITTNLRLEAPGAWCKELTSRAGRPFVMAGAPRHAMALVDFAMKRRSLRPKTDIPEWPSRYINDVPPAEWRPEKKLITPYQTDAIEFSGNLSGALLQHACGAGKTPSAIYWSLIHPGPALIVCLAPARVQWIREIRKFTTASCILMHENASVPLPEAAYASDALFLMAPAAKDVIKRPVIATPYTAAHLAARGVGTPVVYRITVDGVEWCNLVEARFCHFNLDLGDSVQVVPPMRGDGLDPGYLLRFGPVYTLPLPRFTVVGWEMMRAYCDTLVNVGFASVVFDESMKAKAGKRNMAIPNQDGTVRFEKLKNLTSCARQISESVERRLLTTATPVTDRTKDLWAQWDLAEPFQAGGRDAFALRYCNRRLNPHGGFDDSGSSNQEELKGRLLYFVHQVSAKVTHAALPPKRRSVVYLPLSEQDEPGDFTEEFKEAVAKGHGAKREVQLMEAAARKRTYICGRVTQLLASNPEAKIVIFTGRRTDCERLGKAIKDAVAKQKLNVDVPVMMGHGGTSQLERQQMLDDYVHAKSAVLVGTGEAWGTSLDGLQCTDLQLHAMTPYSPGQVIQREGRVYRVGQDRPVLIEYVIAEGTYDERMAEILINKLPAVEEVTSNDEVKGMGAELAFGDGGREAAEKSIFALIDDADFVED